MPTVLLGPAIFKVPGPILMDFQMAPDAPNENVLVTVGMIFPSINMPEPPGVYVKPVVP